MKNLSLTIPGLDSSPYQVPQIPGLKTGPGEFNSLGGIVTNGLELFFMLMIFLTFFWLIWAAFQYIFAGGDKEQLGKARGRMMAAIVGLLMAAIAFAISQYAEQIIQPNIPSPLNLFSVMETAYAQSPTPITTDISQQYGFGDVTSLAEGVRRLTIPTFSIATISVVIYFLLAAFKLITSAGDKQAVESARNMITHSIIGFLILMLVFIIMQFIPEYFDFGFSIIQR